MDTKIIDGDMLIDSSGNPVMVKETEEVLQQVIMCITAEKGGFIYDKDMGIQAVTDVSGEKECKRLEAILRESTEGIEGADIYLDSAQQLIDGRILAGITVTYKDDVIPVEVVI